MKKFLKYFIFIIICIFTFNLKVYATDYTDSTGKYVLTMPSYDFSQFLIDDTHTFQEFLDSFISVANNSQTYYAIITTDTLYTRSLRYFNIYLIPKNENFTNISTFFGASYSSTKNFYTFYSPSINFYIYNSFLFSDNSYQPFGSDFYSSSVYLNFVSCLNGGTCTLPFSTQNLTLYSHLANSIYLDYQFAFIDYGSSSTFYSQTAFGVSLIYYSSLPIIFQYNGGISGYNNYIKTLSLKINGVDYSVGDRIPTYCELYDLCSTSSNTFVADSDSLYTSYTNFSPSDISNYSLSYEFNTYSTDLGYDADPQEYVDNLRFDYLCSGRIDNSDYYSYKSFPCSLTSSYTITDNTINYIFNSISYTENLSQYDKIFVTIKSNYLDSSIMTLVSNFRINFPIGNVYNTDFKGYIYDNFDNLPLNFDMYLSSNNSYEDSIVYALKSNTIYNISYKALSNTSMNLAYATGQSILGSIDILTGTNTYLKDFIRLAPTNNNGVGIAITQYGSEEQLPRLSLFFNSGIVISINSDKSQEFYYVDKQGNVSTGQFNFNYVGSSGDNYNLSFYIDKVDSFINDLSDACIDLGGLTQNFYNNLPLFFQTFIFVIFILFCIYFTYLLIKK